MNFLVINSIALQAGKQGLALQSVNQTPVDTAPSLDNATLARDDNGELWVTGTFGGITVAQEIYFQSFPALLVFSPDTTNFRTLISLAELEPDDLVVDIFYE